jgi:hypothetical protein
MTDDQAKGAARGTTFKLVALVLATVGLVTGVACWRLRGPHDPAKETGTSTEPPPGDQQRGLFHGWPKPEFVLVLTGQQHGYLLPCGCSSPQYGGLERRYNFVKSLREERGWPVVAYDLGDVPQMHGPAKLSNVQGLIKYRYAMEAMKKIGYSAVSFGEYEAANVLNEAIDQYALNDAQPAVLAANLVNKDTLFPDAERKTADWGNSYVGSWQVSRATAKVKVGAVGIIGTHAPAAVAALIANGTLPAGTVIPPSVGGQITASDRKFTFTGADKAIPAELAAMEALKPDFRVLLYQGPVELARLIPGALAQQNLPEFNVILCLSEDEPPGLPDVVGNTFVLRVGHKGKNVGVVGVVATGQAARPFEMRYQLVPLGEEYKTPPEKEKGHPVLALMERYTRELKADDYLKNYHQIPHPTQAAVKELALKKVPALAGQTVGYAGSESCKNCHQHAHDVWTKSPHAHAYGTLETATRPSLRQYDAECLVCHTVGFRYDGGFKNAADTPKQKNVGCESCHGPCDIHKKNPNVTELYSLINPWKAPAGETPAQKKKRELRVESMCRECHDSDNDVHWDFAKWEKKNIIHMTPQE